ncbi:beta-galactosidase GalA [Flavobacterium selenitireducens]|uniref:beta-galactosidase GalA n=1 Tax=Flavobacterium selenitireducens TaxID=2722704 RepID=UPI00168C0151|nr:beta-galactosidase GalA [Flavobacterium selenitireducens]MBD3582857.1 DUF4982 domain-containing protein [Flavobacterium selenitireducens]
MKFRFILLFLLFALTLFAQTRKKTDFDFGWKFQFGHASNPEKDFNYSVETIFSKSGSDGKTAVSPGFNDSNWTTLNLPHDWAVALPFRYIDHFGVQSHGYKPVGGHFPETSIGWYRKHFKLDASDKNQRFELQFDGIYRDAQVWVNGFYCGRNESGYLGANYDVTDFVSFETENVVVVRVDASQYEGWFYEGAGIYRHVWLNQYDDVHIDTDGIFAHAKIAGKKANLTVETTIANDGFENADATVQFLVKDRLGKVVASSASSKISLSEGKKTTINQHVPVSNLRLWSLEDPYLYRISVRVSQNDKLIDSEIVPFGFRTIEIKNNGVFVNGKKHKIKGVNNHQDHAGVGSAIPDHLHYHRVMLEKQMGVNAWRMSHNAPDPVLLMACDSLGMLVMNENRLVNSGKEYAGQFRKLLKRDRNHPSIFMWSIGNEEGLIQKNDTGKRIAKSLLSILRQYDHTRTATYAANFGNEFEGINEVIPVRGFNYSHKAVADYHKSHPGQPIIGTEMGSTVTTRGVYEKDTIRAYVPDQDISFPSWASRAEDWQKLSAENDYWLGGFIWTGFDYRGEPTPYTWPNIGSHFGIMDSCGFPKNLYYYYQSWWTDKDVMHISPHWNWPEKRHWNKPSDDVEVWVNSNADNVELFLNGKSLGKKDMPGNGHLNWTVQYEPGKLEAIGYKRGKKISGSVETTGAPVEVVVTPYKTTMTADGKDVAIVNISVIDKEGRTVPDADNMIRFEIKGDAKIIGVGNGDPSSHEPDKCSDGAWQRSLFNGFAQVIVQAGTTSDFIHFDAKAAGLTTGATDFITVEPAKKRIVTSDKKYALSGEAAKPRPVDQMLGADISFLPELEARGMKFFDKGVEKDAIAILKDHGFNYVRLRIFNEPANEKGYSPGKGFCDLAHTLEMAKRIKSAGMKLLLDFHYSDYWADPGKQYKPKAWEGQSMEQLKKSLYDWTFKVMSELKNQNTLPDMVQVGNEINHGLVWPEGSIANPDGMAQLYNAGVAAVKAVNPKTQMMFHLALGGQHFESTECLDEMVKRNAHFDVIGLSYYPKWHGTINDLEYNIFELSERYDKDVIVVEYSHKKQEVNKAGFDSPNGRAKGTAIWEPLSTWEKFFERDGKSNALLLEYDDISAKFLKK